MLDLQALGHNFIAAIRNSIAALPQGVEGAVVGENSAATDWRTVLSVADVIVRLAARVHVMQEAAADPLEECHRVNVQVTLNLTR